MEKETQAHSNSEKPRDNPRAAPSLCLVQVVTIPISESATFDMKPIQPPNPLTLGTATKSSHLRPRTAPRPLKRHRETRGSVASDSPVHYRVTFGGGHSSRALSFFFSSSVMLIHPSLGCRWTARTGRHPRQCVCTNETLNVHVSDSYPSPSLASPVSTMQIARHPCPCHT